MHRPPTGFALHDFDEHADVGPVALVHEGPDLTDALPSPWHGDR